MLALPSVPNIHSVVENSTQLLDIILAFPSREEKDSSVTLSFKVNYDLSKLPMVVLCIGTPQAIQRDVRVRAGAKAIKLFWRMHNMKGLNAPVFTLHRDYLTISLGSETDLPSIVTRIRTILVGLCGEAASVVCNKV
jgi:hypothetical protein